MDTFFFYLGFLSETFTNHRTAGEGEGISLTPHYHFHPIHRHLEISRAFATERSLLQQPFSNREPLVSERKSLTTILRALDQYTGCILSFCSYNHFDNILRRFDVLTNFPFTKSDYYLYTYIRVASRVAEWS